MECEEIFESDWLFLYLFLKKKNLEIHTRKVVKIMKKGQLLVASL